MKNLIILLAFTPMFCFAQSHDTAQTKRNSILVNKGVFKVDQDLLIPTDTVHNNYWPETGSIRTFNNQFYFFNGVGYVTPADGSSVVSVNGFTGNVVLTTSNITEGANKYFTDARVYADSTIFLAYVKYLISLNVKYSDTGAMLNHYLLSSVAAATYQTALGYTAENVANKATNFGVLNNILYPSTLAVNNLINTTVAGYMPIVDSNLLALGYVTVTYVKNNYYPLIGNPSGFLTASSIAGKVNYSDSSFNGGYMPWYYANNHFGVGSVTSVSAGYGTIFTTITSNGSVVIDTLTICTRLWRNKAIDSLNNLIAAKQNALSGTGFVKISGTTISYDNSTYLTTISGITAGGSLTGTYPNPNIATGAVSSSMLANGAVDFSGTKVTGNLQISNFNSGFSAGAGTYWDGTGGWSVPSWTANPMTTKGDIIYSSDNTGSPVRLGIGSLNQVLGVSLGLPAWVLAATVTSVTVNPLSPLFTSTTATNTTTPVISYSLSNAAAHSYFGNNTGSSAAPAYNVIDYTEIANTPASWTLTVNGTSMIPATAYTVTASALTLTTATLNPTVVTSSLTSLGSLLSLTMADAGNIVFGTTTGTKFGTSTSQKMAWYNATPVVQQSGDVLAAMNTYGFGSFTISGADITTGTISSLRLPIDVAYLDVAQVYTKGVAGAVVTLTDASTIAIDLATANNFKVVLGGNRTLGVPTNIVAGQSGRINFWQDITGTRTITLPWPYIYPGATQPVLSTGKLTMDKLTYDVDYYATSASITATNATPGVFTWTSHGLSSGQMLQFSAGTTTTPVLNTTYWVTVIDANTFNISTTFANAQAGTLVTTSGISGSLTATACGISTALNTDFRR